MLVVAILAASGWYLWPEVTNRVQNNAFDQTMVTLDDVNLRSGPGLNHEVLQVLPAGTEVATDNDIANGFRAVDTGSVQGWISVEYLAAPDHNSIAQVQSVQAAEMSVTESAPVEGPVVEETVAPTVVEEVEVAPEPTVAPTYAPVIAESNQVEAEPQPGERWIEVNRTTRTVTLHDGEIIVAEFNALIGKDPSADGYYSTAIGTYHVHVKEKALAETPFADGVFLTDFVGFDPVRSNGFHSPVRDEFGNVVVTGGTQTLGCVRLSESDAISLFDFATIGMRVEIHD